MLSPRSFRAALVLLALTACGRDDRASEDSTAARPSTIAPGATFPGSAPTVPPPAVGVIPGTAAPITGTVHEVQMIGDANGYRFEPNHITASTGDAVKFVLISGGPHEIAFDLDKVPAESRSQLEYNMPNSESGKSPLLSGTREAWTVSLGGLAPGIYPFVSVPRLPQGMKGEIEIK